MNILWPFKRRDFCDIFILNNTFSDSTNNKYIAFKMLHICILD